MKFEVSKSPYGPKDEIGRLNEITGRSRAKVLERIDASRIYDLSVDYFVGMPAWDFVGDPPYQIWMTHTPNGTIVDNPLNVSEAVNRYVSYSGDAISMYTHCGTHIDTLNHFGYDGVIWNHYKASEHLGARHWNVCGADKFPPIIARAVLLDPAILLLDDPAASIDPATEHEILEAMERAMQGRTTFIVAHRLSTLKYADLVIVLDEGRIAQIGTHGELLDQPGHYQTTAVIQRGRNIERAAS